jgi:hypothetical protein
MTNSEKAGERVFGNVDEVLAERIISRSKENCREHEPEDVAVAGRFGGGKRRTGLIIKIALAATLLLIVVLGAYKIKK